jgi:hypothetical protein
VEPAGERLTINLKSFIAAVDQAGGGLQPVKLWEKNKKIGTTTLQAMALGKVTSQQKRDIREYFSELKDTVKAARNGSTTGSGSTSTKDKK